MGDGVIAASQAAAEKGHHREPSTHCERADTRGTADTRRKPASPACRSSGLIPSQKRPPFCRWPFIVGLG
jgi:hypothetical protein